jgi:hypothetical protein
MILSKMRSESADQLREAISDILSRPIYYLFIGFLQCFCEYIRFIELRSNLLWEISHQLLSPIFPIQHALIVVSSTLIMPISRGITLQRWQKHQQLSKDLISNLFEPSTRRCLELHITFSATHS